MSSSSRAGPPRITSKGSSTPRFVPSSAGDHLHMTPDGNPRHCPNKELDDLERRRQHLGHARVQRLSPPGPARSNADSDISAPQTVIASCARSSVAEKGARAE